MKILHKTLFFPSLFAMLLMSGCKKEQKDKNSETTEQEINGEYEATLTHAPYVPESKGYDSPKKVIVRMEVVEKVMRLADGVEYNFWTFGGKVPGEFIRIREGDMVEFYLDNHPSNKLPHNIDLHAVTGPGGGAESSLTAPGHTSQFSFKAINPGLYMYHCATAPVGMHIANGMYGLIYVEPKEGLEPVDKEFYVMQSEFYTKAAEALGEGVTQFDMQKAMMEHPDYVVFNGEVGAMMGDKALHVEVGETVRLFVGNAGPGLISSFHVIGEIFDKVYVEGGSLINNNVHTTTIPAGGTAIVEFKCEVPGHLTIVDHAVFRAFNKGAIGQIEVVGEENPEIFTGKQRDLVYMPEGKSIQTIEEEEGIKPVVMPKRSFEERMTIGKSLYETNCAACHQASGQGVPNVFPPLAKSDYLMGREDKGIGIVLRGLTGEIVVNGVTYNGVMPQLLLNNDEVANILTYVRNSWGNDAGEMITSEEVEAVRNAGK